MAKKKTVLEIFNDRAKELTRAELIELETAVRGAMSNLPFETYTETEQAYINAAEGMGGEDIDVDSLSTVVSEGSDPGAYVQCWMWVSNEDAGLAEDEDEEDEDDAELPAVSHSST